MAGNNLTINWQRIISVFLKEKGFVSHQIDSYNDFVQNGIQRILTESGPIEITRANEKGEPVQYVITFGQIYVHKPVIKEHDGSTNIMYPQEARHRNLTYHSSLYCDITVKTYKLGELIGQETSNEQLGYIPIMLRSQHCLLHKKTDKELMELGECRYDEGGYFIVSGNEKVIVAQESMPNNIVYCFYKKPPSKIIWQAEIRTQFEYHIKSTSTLYMRLFSKGARSMNTNKTSTFTDLDGLRAQITYIKQDIPVVVLFYAIGFTDHSEIIRLIHQSKITHKHDTWYEKDIIKFLRCSFDEAKEIVEDAGLTSPDEYQDFALDYIGKKGSTVHGNRQDRIAYAIQILNKELLPHLCKYEVLMTPTTELIYTRTKALFVGYVINKIYLCYIGELKEADRDHLANKHFDLTGELMENLFKTIFKRLHKEAKINLTKTIEQSNNFDLMNAIKSKSITNDIKYALSTGTWGRQTGGNPPKTGVAQQHNRLTYSSGISHLRRVNTPLNREGKQAKPRQLHNSHFGYLDPAETPEGQGCGLLKNLAITCHISIGSERSYDLLHQFFDTRCPDVATESRDLHTNKRLFKVFIDGAWTRSIEEEIIEPLYKELLKMRRSLKLDPDISLIFDRDLREFRMFTGGGRCCRPLLIVENLHKLSDSKKKQRRWVDYLSEGIVEYIDVAESEEIYIAMNPCDVTPKHTHLEIHPSVMLGVCTSTIPFANHNQSPRVIYYASMMKQAMGIYASNFNDRFDTLAHILHYPQRPLVSTQLMKHMHFTKMPSGANMIVAIQSYGGFNQEDSMIINKGAIDRGAFRSSFFRTYTDQEKEIVRVGGLMEQFESPNKNETKGIQHGNYGKLGPDGIIEPGSRTIEDDIIIGKTTPIATNKYEANKTKTGTEFKKRDVSTSVRPNEVGIVDRVMLTTNQDGYKYTKVRIRSLRVPEIGDKFSSQHGQKSTIGMIYSQADMPFTKDGIVPDLIINPHAMPSRMTIGQLIECLLGKLSIITGKEGDATPFNNLKVSDISAELEKYGFSGDGTEILYNGETGEQIETRIFIGPTYYQRLKHMVGDKIHCLTMDHEVLTKSGWKFYGQLHNKDEIACMVNGKLEYHLPKEAIYYPDFEGELCHVETDACDLMVTMEHRMVVTYPGNDDIHLVPMKELLGKEYKIVHKVKWEPTVQLDYSTDALTLEGYLRYTTRNANVVTGGNQQMIRLLLEKLGLKFKIVDDTTIDITDSAYECVKFIDENNKYQSWDYGSSYLTQLNSHQMDLLSHQDLNPSQQYTSYKCIADQLQHLSLHRGRTLHVKNVNGYYVFNEYHGEQTYKRETVTRSKQPVFCLQVPGEVFYVRRNGKCCWTGNSRSTGPVTKLTRQPLEGRSKEGGLRTGEMERDVMVAHGAANMVKDRLLYNSDLYRVHVCDLCGAICQSDLDRQRFLCKCVKGGNTTEVSQVLMPYAYKLYTQELMSMNVFPRIIPLK